MVLVGLTAPPSRCPYSTGQEDPIMIVYPFEIGAVTDLWFRWIDYLEKGAPASSFSRIRSTFCPQ